MSEQIHQIFIRQTETRQTPSPHTVYRIEIQGPVRTWSVWRRYKEFSTLQSVFTTSFPSTPLPAMPPKSFWPHTFNDQKKVEERRSGLETWLRAVLSSKDERLRQTKEWAEFLGIPTGRGVEAGGGSIYTSESWLDEYREMLGVAREVRSFLNRREAHVARDEVSDAHQCNLQARKLLAKLSARVTDLENGLEALADGPGVQVMSPGELRRRQDMMHALRDEKDSLLRLVATGRADSMTTAGRRAPDARSEDRHALFGSGAVTAVTEDYEKESGNGDYGFPVKRTQNNGNNVVAKPTSRRVFGNVANSPPKETSETRGLDNEGLLGLQRQKMEDQDLHIEQFSSILQRQKQIGVSIGDELESQNALLADLDERVDRTQGKLKHARKKLDKLK